MDHIMIEDLKQLLGRFSDWCVSLYMPTHRAGKDTEQDPSRFKNLLREAEERLLAKNLRRPDVDAILEQPKNLLVDPVFTRYPSNGHAAPLLRY